MEIRVREAGKVRVVDLGGKLIIGGPEIALRDTLKKLLEDGHTNIVLNLKKLTMIDSSGLGELAACRLRVQKSDGTVRVVTPERDFPYKTMIISGIVTLFEVFDDELAAVGSF